MILKINSLRLISFFYFLQIITFTLFKAKVLLVERGTILKIENSSRPLLNIMATAYK